LAIEGGDGSGKSTVASALSERLASRGHRTLIVREPGGTPLGEAIRALLLDGSDMSAWTEALLFAAQRAQLVSEVVAPALADGTWVISDRTYYSSIAYQGGGRDLGVDLVRQVNEIAVQGVEPDLVFVLDVDVDVALARQHRPDRIGSEASSFHRAVHAAYRSLAADEPDRVFLIDNSVEVGQVVAQMMDHLS
jgi:dTMP kinase